MRHRSILLAMCLVSPAAAPAQAAGVTERVSVGPHGEQANGQSLGAAISADGRFVAFTSAATNLQKGQPHSAGLFLRDRTTGRNRLVVSGGLGMADPLSLVLSEHGRFLVFFGTVTRPGARADVMVHDVRTGGFERVNVGPHGQPANNFTASSPLAISAQGRFVAFASLASNLVPHDTNGSPCPPQQLCGSDVFVRDRVADKTERVSIGPHGRQGLGGLGNGSDAPAMSADGRFVAFESDATNLVPGDTNAAYDIFVHDRLRGTTRRVSVELNGAQAHGDSLMPSISADGRFIAFVSSAPDLVRGDPGGGIYVRDQWTCRTMRVDLGPGGVPGDGFSRAPKLSADGLHVAFFSFAHNLVQGGAEGPYNVFVRDLVPGVTRQASVGPHGRQPDNGSGESGFTISADGGLVAFESLAGNLIPHDTNHVSDVFVHRR